MENFDSDFNSDENSLHNSETNSIDSISIISLSNRTSKNEQYYENSSKSSFFEDYDESKDNMKKESREEEKNEDKKNNPIGRLSPFIPTSLIFLKERKLICSNCKEFFSYKPHNYKKYIKYCKDCKKDLCEECLKEISKSNNSTGKIATHKLQVVNLSFNFEKFKKNDNIYINKNDGDKKNNLKKIINNTKDNYPESPSFSGYKAINDNIKFLKNHDNIKLEENMVNKKLKKIKSIKQLKEDINTPDLIYKIEINNNKEDAMKNFDIFNQKDCKEHIK